MDVLSALVAYLQPAEAIEPRERPFCYPPVYAQLLAGFDAPPVDARSGTPLPQCLSASRKVVGLVGVHLLRALPRSAMGTRDGPYGVHGLFQDVRVVDVRGRVNHRERNSPPVANNVALRAQFAFIRRIPSALLAPGSGHARRVQSCPLPVDCSRSHTPASCHSSRRRQHTSTASARCSIPYARESCYPRKAGSASGPGRASRGGSWCAAPSRTPKSSPPTRSSASRGRRSGLRQGWPAAAGGWRSASTRRRGKWARPTTRWGAGTSDTVTSPSRSSPTPSSPPSGPKG
jgi:hypothetical protein